MRWIWSYLHVFAASGGAGAASSRSTAPVAVTKRLVGKGATIKVTIRTGGSKVVKTRWKWIHIDW